MTDNRPPPTVPTVIVQPAQGAVAVAADTIGALRGTPILLVMVLLNCGFLGAAVWYFRAQQENVTRVVDKLLDRCLPEVHPEAYVVPPHYQPPKRPYVPTPEPNRPDPPQHEGSLP